MVINENNSYINSFTKGMNSDQAYDQLQNTQYTYAKNIRITKNQLIGDTTEDYSSVHEGIVTPVYNGFTIGTSDDDNIVIDISGPILGTATLDNIGIVVVKYENRLCLYKFKIEDDVVKQFQFWLGTSEDEKFGDLKQVSVVLYKELNNVIKAYIATGEYPIFTIRIDDSVQPYGQDIDVDDLINNRKMPTNPVYIQNIISGRLKTSQVQYTYRYYNKYSITSRLAPLTNKFQIIDSNRNKEIGNAEDTETTIGLSLKIQEDNQFERFDRMQIYRLQYTKPKQDCIVSLIYDGEKTNQFNDVGSFDLQTITIEEFQSLYGAIITPKVIEQHQQYLFAANVSDETIIRGITIDKPQLNIAKTDVVLDSGGNDIPKEENTVFDDNGVILFSNDATNYTYKINDYFEDRNVNHNVVKNNYNNIFTSSLVRSLRRDETYKYGIVYYDNKGRRSDVIDLGNIETPTIHSDAHFYTDENTGQIDAHPIGIYFELPQPKIDGSLVDDIIGCQIVRRSSSVVYQKNLLQVALSRPIRQYLYTSTINGENSVNTSGRTASPYYPTGFLISNHTQFDPYYENVNADYDYVEGRVLYPNGNDYFMATSKDNKGLFQIFSSEIDFRRDDALSNIQTHSAYLAPVMYITGLNTSGMDTLSVVEDEPEYNYGTSEYPYWFTNRLSEKKFFKTDEKIQNTNIYKYYKNPNISHYYNSKYAIRNAKDVLIAKYYEGFSNIQYNGANVSGGIKQYKSFTSSVDGYEFDNWVSSGQYDLRIGTDGQINVGDTTQVFESDDLVNNDSGLIFTGGYKSIFSQRPIGPGGSCLLLSIDTTKGYNLDGTEDEFEDMRADSGRQYVYSTYICNIQHDVTFQNAEPEDYVQYFGFGNFFKLEKIDEQYCVVHKNGNKDTRIVVFDGDVYINLHELTTQYKAYDFNSRDSLQSAQRTFFVPMESKVNTCFDYGMNLINTANKNMVYDGGHIEGVYTQNRPVHQYNTIYSDNDTSNDLFVKIYTDASETNTFAQRTYYSEPKENGEFIDNFTIFKPASFIDVDSKYGEITNLLTDKNALYYWQDTAFGKFSVNERSLINDQNGNTIMLGQAGILSRYDYISTKYGMRPYDYCAIAAEGKVYWVDINNRAIVAGNSQEAINLGEVLNVQNIINNNIDMGRIPKVDYDLQNNELICKCLKDEQQIIFNIKYNIATSIYTRRYEDIVYIKNHIYGIVDDTFVKFNYINTDNTDNIENLDNLFLSPIQLSFVVNPSVSTTKVFDSQQIVPVKRSQYIGEHVPFVTTTEFETDINNTNTNSIEPHTDREGNIIYNIPRYGENMWGNRMRGKWLRTSFEQTPHEFFTISHVITKIRQSYS